MSNAIAKILIKPENIVGDVDLETLDTSTMFDPDSEALSIEFARVLVGDGSHGVEGVNYRHTQNMAAAVWTVPHNLNRLPSVTVIDHLDQLVIADVIYVDSNIVQITHAVPMLGTAYIV